MAGERAAPLQDEALRALLLDAAVAAYPGGQADDAPFEFFRANGVYQRNNGRAVAAEGGFEIRGGAVCVHGDGVAPRCRRVLANGDGTYTFVDTADGSAAVMAVTRSGRAAGNMAGERAAPLQDDALRALFVDVSVAASRRLYDAPFELFRANGSYQRNSGRAVAAEGQFEIRDGAVCVLGDGVAPRCRRVLANGDGTYTLIDTADGTSAVMTITGPRAAAGNMAGERAAPLQDDALRALLSDAYATPPLAAGIVMSHPPGEIFRANGVYQRIVGRTSLWGQFEIQTAAVCVWGEDFARQCRRVVANRDGTYTFIDIADGSSAVMTVIRSGRAGGNMAGESAAPLQDEALRTLLSDVSVTGARTALLDDGPSEIFRANGLYQRIAGRGSALGVRFEIRDGAVCVPNTGSAPRCRRVRPNRDGTYTFTDIADGTAAVMRVTALQGAAGNMARENAAPLQDDALRALLVDVSVADFRTGQLYDGPAEIFRANGSYQRSAGRGGGLEGRFEIRDGAVCVWGDAVALQCRRVRRNGNGTYTFIDTADGTAAVMTITPLR